MPAAIGVVVGLLAGWLFGGAILLFALAVLLFFRDPERTPLGSAHAILAPADGRVVGAGPVAAGHRLAPELKKRVSIFMSPLDVHMNRAPVDGLVQEVVYAHGKFGAAYKGDASDINESNALLILTDEGWRVVVVQIAGWLARRIVCDLKPGDRMVRGERFGLIMFGSRVDVYLPDEVSVSVRPGEKARAGRSVLAEPKAVERVA